MRDKTSGYQEIHLTQEHFIFSLFSTRFSFFLFGFFTVEIYVGALKNTSKKGSIQNRNSRIEWRGLALTPGALNPTISLFAGKYACTTPPLPSSALRPFLKKPFHECFIVQVFFRVCVLSDSDLSLFSLVEGMREVEYKVYRVRELRRG